MEDQPVVVIDSMPEPEQELTYELVRRICCTLLAEGKNLSRPHVQEELEKKENLGRKGGNQVVQGYINQFWEETAERMREPVRHVADMPDAFVTIMDRALYEMVAAARKVAKEDLAERENSLKKRQVEVDHSIQVANDSAATADQLRLRAEGELNVVQSVVGDLRTALLAAETRLADEGRKNDVLTSAIATKDTELRAQFAIIQAASQKLEQTNEAHRQEAHRLLKQIDDERQAATKEGRRLGALVDSCRAETDAVRKELGMQREECVRLSADNAALTSRLTEITTRCADVEARANQSQQDLAVMKVRFETAEVKRQDAVQQSATQIKEAAELHQVVAHLQADLDALSLLQSRRQDKK